MLSAIHTEAALLAELTPVAEGLVERHYDNCKPWYPHEYVPYSLGEDFTRGETLSDEQLLPLPDAVRSALFVNLLTEDNLPYYFYTIDRMFGSNGVWREWSHRWTAEEARHSIALRDFVTVTRVLNPTELEDGRMAQMSKGEVPEPPTAVDGFVYVALQELATRIAHRNTGKALQEHLGDHPVAKAGYDLLGRVAADENFHFMFYRDLAGTALKIAPNMVLPAIERQVREFDMPGTGIPGFKAHAEKIQEFGIYGLNEQANGVFAHVIERAWQLESLDEGLSDEAKIARDSVLARIGRQKKAAARLAARVATSSN